MQVLQVLDRLRGKLQEKGDTTQNEKLSAFYETLKSPLFNQILTLQQSIKQLKGQVSFSAALPEWIPTSRNTGLGLSVSAKATWGLRAVDDSICGWYKN